MNLVIPIVAPFVIYGAAMGWCGVLYVLFVRGIDVGTAGSIWRRLAWVLGWPAAVGGGGGLLAVAVRYGYNGEDWFRISDGFLVTVSVVFPMGSSLLAAGTGTLVGLVKRWRNSDRSSHVSAPATGRG